AYFTHLGTNSWGVAVYDLATASPGHGSPLATTTLTFDSATTPIGGNHLTIPVAGGASFDLNLNGVQQPISTTSVQITPQFSLVNTGITTSVTNPPDPIRLAGTLALSAPIVSGLLPSYTSVAATYSN